LFTLLLAGARLAHNRWGKKKGKSRGKEGERKNLHFSQESDETSLLDEKVTGSGPTN
jgi:hypothetical protein